MDKRIEDLKVGDTFVYYGEEIKVLESKIWHRNSKKSDSVYAVKTSLGRTLHFYGFNKVEVVVDTK